MDIIYIIDILLQKEHNLAFLSVCLYKSLQLLPDVQRLQQAPSSGSVSGDFFVGSELVFYPVLSVSRFSPGTTWSLYKMVTQK